MADTYTQLLIQIVIAVKNRDALVRHDIRASVEQYISGIITNNGHKVLANYCMPDHCHILIGLHPKQSISELARDIKANSSKWINDNKLTPFKFNWQEGYGAFSYSRSQLDAVAKYIMNQQAHHSKKTFKDEYLEFLEKFEIEHSSEYLFEWLE